ncbi:hypothetical protein K7432_017590 [Basidiobolus ranarum]|uniref:Uncharacterized protein n=1 Tax=Basidiobolus ranarum TaxID=34480 RepID=A0ABR2VK72_9FUNG
MVSPEIAFTRQMTIIVLALTSLWENVDSENFHAAERSNCLYPYFQPISDQNGRLLREKFDLSAPGLRLKGVVIGSLTVASVLDYSNEEADTSSEEEVVDTATPAVSNDWKMEVITIDGRNIGSSY